MTKKIISVNIGLMPMHLFDSRPNVHACFDDGTVEVLFQYPLYNMNFNEKELIGMTKEQALNIKH